MYLYSENKGADQMRDYRAADLRLSFRLSKNKFSHDVAHIIIILSPIYTPPAIFLTYRFFSNPGHLSK